MPDSRRPWSEDDIAKLKGMAGRFPLEKSPPSWAGAPALFGWRLRS
jgi:hypothetical protein